MNLIAESLTRPKPGESVNGDAAVIRIDGERTLLALVDALGHGPLAAEVADHAREYLAEADLAQGAEALLAGLHQVLSRGRGAAGALLLAAGGTLDYGGVGNVEVRATGASLGVHQVPGILGHGAPRIRIASTTLKVGQRLLMFSDGILERFSLAEFARLPVPEVCHTLLNRFANPTDDATVVVAEVKP